MAKISSKNILDLAYQMTRKIKPDTLLIILERKVNKKWFKKLPPETKVIFAFPNQKLADLYEADKRTTIVSPIIGLSRFSTIRHILITALSRGHIGEKEQIVCVTGSSKNREALDSITAIDMSRQFKGIAGFRKYSIEKKIPLSVIESVLDIAIKLSEFGREDKAVGTIFIIGDAKKVMGLSKQLILNPFKGYKDKEKNIKNPMIKESICELAQIGGAFIVRGDGVLCAAGRLLLMARSRVKILHGLGARHNAAAYITKKTNSVGVVVSESSGNLSIFVQGKLLFELTSRIRKKRTKKQRRDYEKD